MEHEEQQTEGLAGILQSLVMVAQQVDRTKNKRAVEYLLAAMALAVSVGDQGEEKVDTHAIGFLAEHPPEEDIHEEIEEDD